MQNLSLSHNQQPIRTDIPLESSKSESNRALIIQALGKGIELERISIARDSQTMQRLLASEDEVLDVLDAGTTMRFLTAFCAVTRRPAVLTGTARMQQRPIGILVEALQQLGAQISYLGQPGFPPLRIEGFSQTQAEVQVPGHVSSQYISALLMAGPLMPLGLSLELLGKVGSKPYIDMTLKLMGHFGIQWQQQNNHIRIAPQHYSPGKYTVESDWSGASYWYSVAALAPEAQIGLQGLRKDSFQGDSVMMRLGEQLGVRTRFSNTGIVLEKMEQPAAFSFDFTDCPDLAQTVAVICAAKGIAADLHGLESLRIKETDRIAALQNELGKMGVAAEAVGDRSLLIRGKATVAPDTLFDTYEDHRMAMAFAPLALLAPIRIAEPGVVAKSYPTYWEHLPKAGFTAT